MIWKASFSFVLLISIAFTSKLSYAKQKLADEDIEETSELVVNYLGPLLELNGYTLEDFPSQLKYLTAKYYLIFSRGVEPLDTLEKMVSDYEIIQESQYKVAEDFQEYVEHFITINASDNKKALKKLVNKVLQSFSFDLQVVTPRDAIKFLLYQEAYPDIMKILSLMVHKHYDAYLEVRAKEKKHPGPSEPSNDTDPSQPPSSTDDEDFGAMIREIVASHGRLELVKRLVTHLEKFIPPVDRLNVNESILDYLDDLHEFLETKSNGIWRFIKGPLYAAITDKFIAKAEKFYGDVSIVVPFHEIVNVFDAVVLNSNDRRALMILTSDIPTIKNYDLPNRVTNAKDVFNFISEMAINHFTAIHGILLNTTKKTNSKKDSESIFLEYMDKILAPHDISTNDLSKEVLAIISRTFKKISSIEPPTTVSTTDLQFLRKSLQKLRDSFSTLIPELSDSNHIELQTLLQSIVNKFGAFIFEQEGELVQIVNGVLKNFDEKKKFEEDLSNFALRFEIAFQNIPIKPSEFLKEKLFELVEMIDAFINFTSF